MPVDLSKSLEDIVFQNPPTFEFHVFICQNTRPLESPLGSCLAKGSEALWTYMKSRVETLNLGKVRINKSGCLGQCARGPVLVIYPEGLWFQVKTTEDIEKILENYMIKS